MSGSKQSEGICVGIRMRPLNDKEIASGQEKLFECQTERNAVSQMNHGQAVETSFYDRVFGEGESTAEVYAHIGKNTVSGVMNGINGTIFAYGQTSSGKTHTMLGGGNQAGVLNMAAQDIFSHIEAHPNRDFLLRASFVEIYNENIRDLLSLSNAGADSTVAIREDPRRGVYCEAQEVMIADYESITQVLRQGTSRRAVEATAMNDTSSRSHTIFKLVVESREGHNDGQESDGAVLVATLNLVDLAGSESVKHTGAIGQRAKEGGKINQSLLSLSRVIHSLSVAGAHVNYRDSKLTRLLQPSLSGNAKMSIICCITPAAHYLEETRSTLQFASRAKLVETHATVNEVLDETAQIKRLKKQLEELKALTNGAGGVGAAGGGGAGDDEGLQARVLELEAANAAKDTQIAQLRSGENKRGSPVADTRRGKRRRSFLADMGGIEEGEQSKESIKNTLLMHLKKRAQGPMDESAPSTSTTNPTSAPAPAQVVVERPLNPMLLGLRNQLMKELDGKLVKQRSKVEGEGYAGACIDAAAGAASGAASGSGSGSGSGSDVAALQAELGQLRHSLLAATAQVHALCAEKDASQAHLLLNDENIEHKAEGGVEMLAQIAMLQEEKMTLQEEVTTLLEQLEADAPLSTSAPADALIYEELQSLRAELTEATQGLATAEEEVVSLLEQLEQLGADVQLKESHALAEKDKEIARMLGALEEVQTALAAQLEAQFALSTSNSSTAAAAAAEYALMVAGLEAALVLKDAQLSSMTEQLTSMAQALASKDAEISLRVAESNELASAFEAAVALSSAESNASLEAVGAQLAQKCAVLQVAVERAEMAEGTAQCREVEIIALGERVALAEAQEAQGRCSEKELRAEVKVLQEGVQTAQAGMTSHAQELATAQQALALAQGEVLALQELHEAQEQSESEERQGGDQIETLQAQIETLTVQCEEHQATASATTDIIAELEASLTQALNDQQIAEEELATAHSVAATAAAATVSAAAAEIAAASTSAAYAAQLQATVDFLTAEVNEARARAEAAKSVGVARMNELEVTQSSLDGARKEMERDIASSQAELGSKEAEVSRLMAQLRESTQRGDVALQRLAEIDNAHIGVEAGDMAVKKRVSQLQTTVDLLQGEKSSLLLRIELAEKESRSAQGGLSVQVEQLQRQLGEKNAHVERLSQSAEQGARAGEAAYSLTKRVEALSAEAAVQSATLVTASNRVLQLEAEVTVLMAAQSPEAVGLEAQLAALQSELFVLRQQKDSAQEDLGEITARLRKSQEGQAVMRREWESAEMRLGESAEALEQAQAAVVEISTELDLAERALAKAEANTASTSASTSDPSSASDSAPTSTSAPVDTDVALAVTDAVRFVEHREAILSLELRLVEATAAAENAQVDAELLGEELRLKEQRVQILTEEIGGMEEEHAKETEALREESDRLKHNDEGDARQIAQLSGVCKLQAEQLANLEGELEVAQKELRALEVAVSAAELESAEWKEAAITASATASDYVEQLEASASLLSREQKLSAEAAEHASDAADNDASVVKTLRAGLSDAGGRLQEAEVAREALGGEVALLEAQVQELQMQAQADVGELEAAVGKAASTAAEAGRALYEVANSELAGVRVELEVALTVVGELEEELAQARAEIEAAEAASLVAQEKLQGGAQVFQGVDSVDAEAQTEAEASSEEGASASVAKWAGESELQLRVCELESEVGASQAQVTLAQEQYAAGFEKYTLLAVQLAQKETQLAASEGLAERLEVDGAVTASELGHLRDRMLEQEDDIAKLQGDLEALRTLQGVEGAQERGQGDVLAGVRRELQVELELRAVCEDKVAFLHEQLEAKDARMAHLEACKLTKEQMEKIKVIKEEKKKYQEDCKVLKKQLHQLSVKFDELRSAKSVLSEGGPSPEYVISDLKVQLVTTSQQLSNASEESKLLKGKLKECAMQLKEYESDHGGVVAVLEKYGVDCRGLLPLEVDESADSQGHSGDIAEAVAVLGEKLDQARAAVTRREAAKGERLGELESRLEAQQAEADEARAQRQALEKRLDVLKGSARAAREASALQVVELETLSERAAQLQSDLLLAERRVATGSEGVSSEVQALEEENIELLKENKDLRVEVSRFRAGSVGASASLASGSGSVSIPASPTTAAAGALSGSKRTFGTDISNAPSKSAKKENAVEKGAVGMGGLGGEEDSQSHSQGVGVKGKVRRTRMKAKALVDAGEGSGAPAEEAGECKQS